MICIWCKRKTRHYSVEHIIPESLGCPDNFTFEKGEVCQKCNNKLGSIDKVLLHEFEILAFHYGVPRKKGKSPRINSIPNIKGRYVHNAPVYNFNMEKYPVLTNDGQKLSPFTKNSSAIDCSFERDGKLAKISFQQSIGKHKKFNRAITKIAFSSVAYFLGTEVLLSEKYDHIRDFVLFGNERRPIILMKPENREYRHGVLPPKQSQQDGSYFIILTIAGLTFMVDLSEELVTFKTLKLNLESMHEINGTWCVLPLDFAN